MSAHAYNRHCGCASCGRIERADERRDEYIADRIEQYGEAELREAEEYTAGTFDGDHYTEVTLALYELHRTDPDKLPGSALLTRLYQLARTEHDAMRAELRRMAAAEWDRWEAA